MTVTYAGRVPESNETTATEMLSSVAQDYLKIMWTVQEWSGEKISTKLLAEKLGVSASTVSEAVRRLADQGLVDHERYGAISLTDEGRQAAVAMVRRHRLIETFLVRELGYGWDEVHDEAEILEHAISDRLLEAIDARLGRPLHDPHGDPIPSADGVLAREPSLLLAEAPAGHTGTILRISDRDPGVLRELDESGVGPGIELEVTDASSARILATARVAGRAVELELAREVAAAIWVTA